jgi:hypothetical protein
MSKSCTSPIKTSRDRADFRDDRRGETILAVFVKA